MHDKNNSEFVRSLYTWLTFVWRCLVQSEQSLTWFYKEIWKAHVNMNVKS